MAMIQLSRRVQHAVNRMTLVLLAVLFCFFAATLVLPLTTMGDPVYDTAMLRARWYGVYGLLLVHAGTILLLVVLILSCPSGREMLVLTVAQAATLLLALIFLAEEGRIIRYGDLIGTYDEAWMRLTISRWACFLLASLALLAQGLALRWLKQTGSA